MQQNRCFRFSPFKESRVSVEIEFFFLSFLNLNFKAEILAEQVSTNAFTVPLKRRLNKKWLFNLTELSILNFDKAKNEKCH